MNRKKTGDTWSEGSEPSMPSVTVPTISADTIIDNLSPADSIGDLDTALGYGGILTQEEGSEMILLEIQCEQCTSNYQSYKTRNKTWEALLGLTPYPCRSCGESARVSVVQSKRNREKYR